MDKTATIRINGVANVDGMFGRVTSGFATIAKSAAVAGAATATAGLAVSGALLKIAVDTAKVGDKYQKMSVATGISTEHLSAMDHALSENGVTLDVYQKAIVKQSKVITDYSNGVLTAKDSISQLEKSSGMSIDTTKQSNEVFIDLINALGNVKNSSEQAALAQEIFGKSGYELLKVANSSGSSIKELTKQAKDLGIVWTDLEANRAASLLDRMSELSDAKKGLVQLIGKSLIPVFEQFFVIAVNGFIEFRKNIDETDIENFAKTAGVSMTYVADSILTIIEVGYELKKLFFDLISYGAKFAKFAPAGIVAEKLGYVELNNWSIAAEQMAQNADNTAEKISSMKDKVEAFRDSIRNINSGDATGLIKTFSEFNNITKSSGKTSASADSFATPFERAADAIALAAENARELLAVFEGIDAARQEFYQLTTTSEQQQIDQLDQKQAKMWEYYQQSYITHQEFVVARDMLDQQSSQLRMERERAEWEMRNQWSAAFAANFQSQANLMNASMTMVNATMSAVGSTIASGIVDGTMDAEQAMKGLLKLAIQLAVKIAMAAAAYAIFGPAGGAGGGFVAALFHNGGLVRSYHNGGPVQSLHSGGFPAAPLKQNEVYAKLLADEYVIPPGPVRSIGVDNLEYMRKTGQMPNGGGSVTNNTVTMPVTFNINAMDGESVRRVVISDIEPELRYLSERNATSLVTRN